MAALLQAFLANWPFGTQKPAQMQEIPGINKNGNPKKLQPLRRGIEVFQKAATP
jgi:hypothetical protein